MIISNNCLIDNWSLEYAGYIIESDVNRYINQNKDIFYPFGGFSNFINAMLLYDKIQFIDNGFQTSWNRFSFKDKLLKNLIKIEPLNIKEKWYSHFASEDFGAKYYLIMSKYLDSDLFVSPERAEKISRMELPSIDNDFIELLNKIDTKIKQETESIWLDNVKIGIQKNLILPSLTHYVLSETSSRTDMLDVILQIKRSQELRKLIQLINESCSNTSEYMRLQTEIEDYINKCFNKSKEKDKSWSVGINVLFLSISKSIGIDQFKHSTYLTFLKDLINCRTETYGLQKDIERIFKIKLE